MTKNNGQIIDDLDTRCPYHCSDKVGQCNNPSQETPHTYCINNKDCIYKQYAHKEQECEELKAENNTYKSSIVANLDKSISKRYRELLEENDQLKETIEGLLSIQYKLADNNKQLRQTLAEIEEITYELTNEEYTDFIEGKQKQILQKINEV